MDQKCVRINPRDWVHADSENEEHAILVTVERPRSHEVFNSKNIVFLGPLGLDEGGIPLRVMAIGPGNRDVAMKDGDGKGGPFHVTTTSFYAHYCTGEDLVAAQLEILWFFQKFAQNEQVPGIPGDVGHRILTLDGHSPPPRTAYDERTHQYVYQGWRRAHFLKFWEEYKFFKDSVHVFNKYMKFVHNEKVDWKKLQPPRSLTQNERKMYEQESQPKLLHEPSGPSKLDMTLDELVMQSQSSKKSPLRKVKSAGIVKARTPSPGRARFNENPRKRRMENSPNKSMAGNPTTAAHSRDIFATNRINRFSRRTPQDGQRNRRSGSQPNRFRNHHTPLTESNMACFQLLTGANRRGQQPRSPPEEPYTLGVVDPNKGHLVEKYLEDQAHEECTPMDLD